MSNQLSAVTAMIVFTIALAPLLGGCGQRPPKLGVSHWIPQSTGGPIETRPLPSAASLSADYRQWLESETTAKVRLYEAVLQGATNQLDFTVKVGKGDTPLGATHFTTVTFIYRDPTNGQYQLERDFRGKHKPDFLKLGTIPRKVLLQPIGLAKGSEIPRLQIVAFEGVEAQHVVVALPGHKRD